MAPSPRSDLDEIARLRLERDSAYQQLDALRGDLRQLTAMVAGQNDRLDQVVSMLRRRESQLKRAEAENRKLRKALGLDDPDPKPKGTPPSTPTKAGDDPGSSAPGDPAGGSSPKGDVGEATPPPPEPDPAKPEESPQPRSRSRGGRRPPPAHLPADEERHAVCACPACAGRVLKRDVLVTRIYTVVESYVRVRTIRRDQVVCADPECNRSSVAPMPPMPCERALYDCRFLAWLVTMKFGLLVPLDRIRTHLLAQGIDLAEGTLVHLIQRAAELADAVDGEHMRQLKAGLVMGFDGTGLKTLIPGQVKAWDGYLEVYTRDELTVFQYDLTKHADRLRLRLNGFEGILVCDAESRNAAGAPGATFANCNAHPRRALRDAERAQPRLAVQGARFFQALYEVEEEADRLGLSGEALVAFRQRSRRILQRFRQWLEGVAARPLPPSDPVRKVALYYLGHFEDLTRFADHAEIPLDNNASEREFQRHAKLRVASLFAGSVEGAHRWATLLGVVRTTQKCGLDVQAYLTWMFERRGTHRKRFDLPAVALTPMAYREGLSAVSRVA